MNRQQSRLIGMALFGAAALFPSTSLAHDHWLEVEPFHSPNPVPAKVYLFVGEQFASAEAVKVRQRSRYPKFELVSAGARRDLLKEIREDLSPLAVLGAPTKAGSHVLSLESAPVAIEIPAKAFQSYLLEERLIDALLLRAQNGTEDLPGRERYTRSLKALVQVGPKLDDHVTKPVGTEIEIVPLVHPYGLGPAATLTVQVLFKGKPLPGRAITATNRLRGNVQSKTARTDASGKAYFQVTRRGDWMFGLVHITPASGDVEWRSYWANMTFSLPDAG